VVTEVYLPYIHYAASLPVRGSGSEEDDVPQVTGSASTSSLINNPNADSRSSTPLASQTRDASSRTAANAAPLELSVDVKVSSGTTTLHGQTLKWTYDAPASETTLTLQVRRKNGPIGRKLGQGQAQVGQQGAWGDVCPSCVIA
jgi:hypothetical protein